MSAPDSLERSVARDAVGRVLRARGLAYAIDRRYVLLDLDLDVVPGEVVAIAGPNGAGKSTLLGVLCGALDTDRGDVVVDGVSRGDVAALARKVGLVGHLPGLYLDLDAVENLRLFATLAGCDVDDHGALAALAAVGLHATDARRPVRHYSRGMAQRAALARLDVCDVAYWLLDEPSTGLDPAGCALLAQRLRRAADDGRGVLFVSHDAGLLSCADRVLDLDGGRLRQRADDHAPIDRDTREARR